MKNKRTELFAAKLSFQLIFDFSLSLVFSQILLSPFEDKKSLATHKNKILSRPAVTKRLKNIWKGLLRSNGITVRRSTIRPRNYYKKDD